MASSSSSSSASSSDSEDDRPPPPLPPDLEHVARMLAGEVAVPAGGRGRGRGRGQPGARRHRPPPPPRPAPPPPDPHADPGPLSTPAAAHCSACDCWVPRGGGSWAGHVAGIRHRRTVLSLRLTGRRDAVVVSAFEPDPGWRARQRRRRAASPDGDTAALHTACMKELLRHAGLTDGGGRVAERLSGDRLADAGDMVTAAFEAGRSGHVVLPGATPAVIAAAAGAVRGGRRPRCAGAAWDLTVLPAEPHPLDLAATTAGLCLLADALRAEPAGLTGLCVDASPWASADEPRPDQAARLWGLVLRRFAESLWANGTLARLEVRVPVSREGDADALRRAGREAGPARRLAVASAGHRKAARVCGLYVLPLEVLGAVMDVAIRRGGCEVVGV